MSVILKAKNSQLHADKEMRSWMTSKDNNGGADNDIKTLKTPKVLARIVVEKMKAAPFGDLFENQRRNKFFSLFVTYDTQAVHRYASGVLASKDLELSVNVKLIDFAHVFDTRSVSASSLRLTLQKIKGKKFFRQTKAVKKLTSKVYNQI